MCTKKQKCSEFSSPLKNKIGSELKYFEKLFGTLVQNSHKAAK